jgi:hypothetical protein
MKKQTAVEWLVDEIRNHIADGTLNAIAISELKMQAKEIEKEQIHNAFDSGVCHAIQPTRNPFLYYYETYK